MNGRFLGPVWEFLFGWATMTLVLGRLPGPMENRRKLSSLRTIRRITRSFKKLGIPPVSQLQKNSGPVKSKLCSRIPSNGYFLILIEIKFYSPIYLGQETAKGPFGLRVKLPPAHLSTTHDEGFTLSLLMLNVKQRNCECQFLVFKPAFQLA